MRLKLLLLFFTGFLCIAVSAQTVKLAITLKAEGKDTVTAATIKLFILPQNILVKALAAKPVNQVEVKANKTYRLQVTSMGYDTIERTITLTDKAQVLDLALVTSIARLHDVTVEARKPLMRQEDDKTLVDAEPLAGSSTNAYEVLEKVPGAVLDQDGNVYLNSATPATVYINGVQMRMSTDDIAALLKSLPAGSVSRIEIIRTPSARFDAANSGGIINIVLKKGVQVGTSGSANVRVDQGVYNNVTGGITLNRAGAKARQYLSYQYTRRHYFDDITSLRYVAADTSLSQKSFTKYAPVTNYISGGMGVTVNNKFDISYDIRITATHNNNDAATSNTIKDVSTQQPVFSTQSPINSNGNALVINNTLFAKYKLDSAGSEWDNEVDYIYTHNTNGQVYTQESSLPQQVIINGNGNNTASSNYINVKSDLTFKLPHAFSFETGVKFSSAANNNMALYYLQPASQPKALDSFKTNTFSYKENIGSGYIQLSKLYHGITFKGGLRLEYTDISGNQTVPKGMPFSIKRTDLFPYLYLRYNLFSVFGYPLVGNITLRRSILRPGYEQLNPSPQFVDQFTYNSGNANLKPQFTTNYEVNATYNDFPVFAIGINNTKDVFSQVTYQNDTTKIAFRTYDNLGSYKEIYWRLFGAIPGGHKYFMYAGVQFNHVKYSGQYGGAPLNYSRASWTFFTGHQFKATSTLSFSLNGWMLANGFRLFNELKTMGQLNLSATKNLLHKKLSVIASVSDIFLTNKSQFSIQQAAISVTGRRIQDSRRLGITLRYNFGISHNEEKKPTYATPPPEGGEPVGN